MIFALLILILIAIYLLCKRLKNKKHFEDNSNDVKSDRLSYINYALRKNLMGNLFEFCMNPEKEITESIGAIKNLLNIKYVKDHVSDPNVECYCLGDGRTPRTAAIISAKTNWNVHSIDPELNIKNKYYIIRNTRKSDSLHFKNRINKFTRRGKS